MLKDPISMDRVNVIDAIKSDWNVIVIDANVIVIFVSDKFPPILAIRRSRWGRLMKRPKVSVPKEHSVVCSKHFREDFDRNCVLLISAVLVAIEVAGNRLTLPTNCEIYIFLLKTWKKEKKNDRKNILNVSKTQLHVLKFYRNLVCNRPCRTEPPNPNFRIFRYYKEEILPYCSKQSLIDDF